MTTKSLQLLLAVLLLAGCGGATASGSGTPATYSAPEAASHYTSEPESGPAVTGEGGERVARVIEELGKARSVALAPDARLARLASALVPTLSGRDSDIPRELIDFYARSLGLVEPTPAFVAQSVDGNASSPGSLSESISEVLSRQRMTHYGGTVATIGGARVAVVLLSARPLTLNAVPRAIAVSRPFKVEGRLDSRFVHPELIITRANGNVTKLSSNDERAFSFDVDTATRGVYQVELAGQGADGEAVLANFPVYVGVDPPTSLRIGSGQAPERLASEVERTLLLLVNGTRHKAHLSKLEPHAGLARVAHAHSLDMVQHKFVAHTSPSTGTASDRVSRAGYSSGLVLENIARAYSAKEIHEGLMDSPGHRANILNPDVSDIGIGVIADDENGRQAYVATELFVRLAKRIDVSSGPERVLSMINQTRVQRGAPKVQSDSTLAREAAAAAREFFQSPSLSQQAVIDTASAKLKRFGIAFRRVAGLMVVVNSLEEAKQLEPTLDSSVRWVGIGVAQGARPDTGPNAIAVVIILAWPR